MSVRLWYTVYHASYVHATWLALFAASYCGLTGSGGWSTGKLSQKLVEVSCAILILEQRLPYHIHLCFSCRDTKPTRDEHMVTIIHTDMWWELQQKRNKQATQKFGDSAKIWLATFSRWKFKPGLDLNFIKSLTVSLPDPQLQYLCTLCWGSGNETKHRLSSLAILCVPLKQLHHHWEGQLASVLGVKWDKNLRMEWHGTM